MIQKKKEKRILKQKCTYSLACFQDATPSLSKCLSQITKKGLSPPVASLNELSQVIFVVEAM